MTGFELETTLASMQALVCRDDLDITRRDAADVEFRRLFRLLPEHDDDLPRDVRQAVRQALLSLVGDDDWSAACAHMARARRLFAVHSG